MADIATDKIDVIVVYKVDRLTRALTDFARIVEVLDARRASFVSLTQALNSTTSVMAEGAACWLFARRIWPGS